MSQKPAIPSHRVPLRRAPSIEAARQKFRAECSQRIRKSRETVTNRRRSKGTGAVTVDALMDSEDGVDRIIEQELARLKDVIPTDFPDISLEEALALEIELRQEYSNAVNEFDEYLRAEEQELEALLDTHLTDSLGFQPCFICSQQALHNRDPRTIVCDSCGFYIQCQAEMGVKELTEELLGLGLAHSATCSGKCLFSFRPETGLLMMCSLCSAMLI